MTCVPDRCRRDCTGGLLLILSFLLFADQQLVAPNLHTIGADFNLSDDGEGWLSLDFVLGGMLPLCFFALGTPISLSIGPLIDRSHRRNLFVLLIFLAELPCLLTYFATDVWHLLLLRGLTGISMAGAEPLIYSIMSDMYGQKERTVMVRRQLLLLLLLLLLLSAVAVAVYVAAAAVAAEDPGGGRAVVVGSAHTPLCRRPSSPSVPGPGCWPDRLWLGSWDRRLAGGTPSCWCPCRRWPLHCWYVVIVVAAAVTIRRS